MHWPWPWPVSILKSKQFAKTLETLVDFLDRSSLVSLYSLGAVVARGQRSARVTSTASPSAAMAMPQLYPGLLYPIIGVVDAGTYYIGIVVDIDLSECRKATSDVWEELASN